MHFTTTRSHKKHTSDPIYSRWKNMRRRCTNPKDAKYKDYGGRGITVCTEWLDDFYAFAEYVDALERPSELHMSIDRINNDGNYEPGNIRWATRVQQQNNRRPSRHGERSCTGHVGVVRVPTGWQAQIYVDKRTVYVGHYKTLQRAVRAVELGRKLSPTE